MISYNIILIISLLLIFPIISIFRLKRRHNVELIPSIPNYMDFKMVLCVRQDLGMGKGKVAVQCSHATLGAYKQAKKHYPSYLESWESHGQAKIVLKISDKSEMFKLANKAESLRIPYYIVYDAGRTQIKSGECTVIAIGPAPVISVNQVTDHLKLL
ncbi:peptidyl-tRNA hydrolase 2 protein, putative [Cryptosporidium muris RN66]|uniref:peptidyl-tRNA hydrolase n=1 Tax=Cryptosporidium muris (strain RN66) TaxID=441375 RepID=B6AC13_CRYMR|nr:peptidyl-tRNA hydrolase 2 protein, putative [Cryptosporidium muris RN66]EEA05366.1 peptidyl-tRNA hydrolase 2 protein, putative [Cryptosporidium muris RN66]|eukprot:XP_002139715.1 peptidyl-tRNA hydrolase 2 protein [Cryptosporidium muris RN66]